MVKRNHTGKLAGRYSTKCNYDKSFILQVLEEVDKGVARQRICEQYGVQLGTLKRWLAVRKLGIGVSGLKQPVSPEFKRTVVRAVQGGRLSMEEAQRRYSIQSDKTIRRWMKELNGENGELVAIKALSMKKNKQVKDSPSDSNSKDVKALQEALVEAQLKIAALNTLIDVAEEQLKINIRKKPGAKQ